MMYVGHKAFPNGLNLKDFKAVAAVTSAVRFANCAHFALIAGTKSFCGYSYGRSCRNCDDGHSHYINSIIETFYKLLSRRATLCDGNTSCYNHKLELYPKWSREKKSLGTCLSIAMALFLSYRLFNAIRMVSAKKRITEDPK